MVIVTIAIMLSLFINNMPVVVVVVSVVTFVNVVVVIIVVIAVVFFLIIFVIVTIIVVSLVEATDVEDAEFRKLGLKGDLQISFSFSFLLTFTLFSPPSPPLLLPPYSSSSSPPQPNLLLHFLLHFLGVCCRQHSAAAFAVSSSLESDSLSVTWEFTVYCCQVGHLQWQVQLSCS